MATHQKEDHKVKMTDGKRAIIQQLFQEYDIESTSNIQDALKDLLGGIQRNDGGGNGQPFRLRKIPTLHQ